MDRRAAKGRYRSRQMVGTLSGCSFEHARNSAEYFQSEYRRGGSERTGRASSYPGEQSAILPKPHGQPWHHEFAHLDGFWKIGGHNVQHLPIAFDGDVGTGLIRTGQEFG